ncbi:phospholipase A2 inhibitor and Ly6/PLAUR domain-containing protein-like isoform X2 [Xenopus tropicalis]|uniref:Phospholipase A2 inhibitor and Ly6/PLAUR domain-containing protein-like isoform X2 n=1 Tax=Xenopus tropicalis TaxID=8364 RepID=A0A8J1JXA6_XENTR|nr:phospholipase A2 inhibitor and Ly6/PLAUR domain-containing protein-like isoform X2 [Xenopus tropicalis]
MGSLLAILCVLSVFAATGYSLSCMNCQNFNGETCSGGYYACPTNQVCGFMVSKFSMFSIGKSRNEYQVTRYCAPQELCNLTGSFRYPTFNSTFASSCCYTDKCTPATPTLPDNMDKSNGLTCPACFTNDSNSCDLSQRMPCYGNETVCYQDNGILPAVPSYSLVPNSVMVHGCATKSLCDIVSMKKEQILLTYININSNLSCLSEATAEPTDGVTNVIGHHYSFLIPAAIALFLHVTL